MALQEDYRQKYRHYGEFFISPSVIGLPCFSGFWHRRLLHEKNAQIFTILLGLMNVFYLNLQSISIAPVKELKLLDMTFSRAVPLFMMTLYIIQEYSPNYQSQFSTKIF